MGDLDDLAAVASQHRGQRERTRAKLMPPGNEINPVFILTGILAIILVLGFIFFKAFPNERQIASTPPQSDRARQELSDAARRDEEARAAKSRDEESSRRRIESLALEEQVRLARPVKKTREQRVDEDPVLQRFISDYPDLEGLLKNRRREQVSLTLRQLVLLGSISLDMAKYVNAFNYSD